MGPRRSCAGSQIRGRINQLGSDVIMATAQVALEALLQTTRDVPIVFNTIADPVGAGYVDTLARPGGNATGFIMFEYSLAGKWLQLLKQIAPNVTRAAVLRDPSFAAGVGQFAVIQSVRHPLEWK